MTTVEQRENASDSRFAPLVHYVYILRLEDGTFYIGQTNDLSARVVEHRIDAGAQATKGKKQDLVWFSHTHDRKSAQQMEQRLKSALKRSPMEIEEIADRFSGLLDLVRPQKTLKDLQEEERAFNGEMAGSFHHVPVAIGWRKPACGWECFGTGYDLYGTSDWEALHQMKREQDALELVGGRYHGRTPCRRCLALAPKSTT